MNGILRSGAAPGTAEQLVTKARQMNCSDVHLTEDQPCVLRINGTLVESPWELADHSRELILSMCSPAQKAELESGNDVDFATETMLGDRQRVNVYHVRGKLACAIRLLNSYIPTLEQLRLPPVLETLADKPRGLVLVTGPTGSGKSTTLAAMLDHVNKTRAAHILTIEDPIEYVYQSGKAMIHQREVGPDVGSFAGALRSALREDPDVILVGEMRDFETISAAVTAAETGHLVLSTLHTTGAASTVERIIDVCPPESQQQMRTQLSMILRGVITQALLPLADGSGRIAATEILVGTDAVLNLIREGKCHQLGAPMQSGAQFGMHTLNNDLAGLVRKRLITRETAMQYSTDPKDLEPYLAQ